MTKKRKTKTVNKNQYRAFLAKAKDFAFMMEISLEWVIGILPKTD